MAGIGTEMTLRCRTGLLGTSLLGLLAASPAGALEYQVGDVNVDAILAVSAQGATYEAGPEGSSGSDGNLIAFARLNLEWISDTGRVYGLRAETQDGSRRSEDLAADEIYAYFASELGRFELGRQDGAADVMSFHAPVMALGQIRGDFSEYAGLNASLSPTDTRDSPKLVYLSPPLRGIRFGVSYAPEFSVNKDAGNPRRRIIQRDAVEAAAQYARPLARNWTLGASVALARGRADPQTQRRDLSSWSTGLELRHEELIIGAAYVDNGDSNDLIPVDEREVNAGIAWRAERWGAAVSWARNESIPLDLSLIGAGGFYSINEHIVLRADAVFVNERPRVGSGGSYHVLLVEVGFEL
jgi:predicted porin